MKNVLRIAKNISIYKKSWLKIKKEVLVKLLSSPGVEADLTYLWDWGTNQPVNLSVLINDLPFHHTCESHKWQSDWKSPTVLLSSFNLNLNIPFCFKKCVCETVQQSQGYLCFIIKASEAPKWVPRLNLPSPLSECLKQPLLREITFWANTQTKRFVQRWMWFTILYSYKV